MKANDGNLVWKVNSKGEGYYEQVAPTEPEKPIETTNKPKEVQLDLGGPMEKLSKDILSDT